jgi:hypothetical protein
MDTAAVTGNNDMFALMHVLIDSQFVRANKADVRSAQPYNQRSVRKVGLDAEGMRH